MCHQCNKSENVRFVIGDTIDNINSKSPLLLVVTNHALFEVVFMCLFWISSDKIGVVGWLQFFIKETGGEGRGERGEWLIYQIIVCIGCTWKGQNGNKQELWFCDQHQLHNQLTFSYCWKVIYIYPWQYHVDFEIQWRWMYILRIWKIFSFRFYFFPI